MIYLSIAAVVIALLALIGFRWWLTTARLATEMTLHRIAQLEARPTYNWLVEQVAALDKRLGHVEASVLEFESRPVVDLSKHDAAVVNLARQLKELADHVDKEIKRVQSRDVGALSMGRNRLVG